MLNPQVGCPCLALTEVEGRVAIPLHGWLWQVDRGPSFAGNLL